MNNQFRALLASIFFILTLSIFVGCGEEKKVVVAGKDGTIDYPGQDQREKIYLWEDITSISAGTCLTLGLTSEGEVYAAGYETDGQLNAKQWTGIKVIDGDRKSVV